MGRVALVLDRLECSLRLPAPEAASTFSSVPAHFSRKQLAARMYPEQVEKLEALCEDERARCGRPVSYNQMLCLLVDRGYQRLRAKNKLDATLRSGSAA